MTAPFEAHVLGRAAYLSVTGELDHDNGDQLVAAAIDVIAHQPGLTELHLDFAGLTAFDNAGLAAVLLIHRKVTAAGMILRLDHRPACVDHTLSVTGTRDHLLGVDASQREQSSTGEHRSR